MSTPQTILAFGDSITAGSALTDDDPARSWTLQIEAQSGGQIQFNNHSRCGRPTDSVAEFERVLASQARPDLLLIALGANDARDVSGACVHNALANIGAMIDLARARFGADLKILLAGPTNIHGPSLGPTRPIAKERAANVAALTSAIESLAQTRNCAFVALDGVVPPASLSRDGVHPDASGNDAIARVMREAISSALDLQ